MSMILREHTSWRISSKRDGTSYVTQILRDQNIALKRYED